MTCDTPLVSILMSVHNGGVFLRAAIESVQSQTFTDYEFIVTDDGSRDGSAKILSQYAREDSRICVITHLTTVGLTKSLNEGLQKCRGKYIARMDADDICIGDRFRRQVHALEKRADLVAVGSRIDVIDAEGRINSPSWTQPLNHAEIDAFNLRYGGGGIPHPSAMLRREAVLKVGGYNEKFLLAQDGDLFLRMAEIGQLANLPEVGLRYRMYDGQSSVLRRASQLVFAAQAVRETGRRRGIDVGENVSRLLGDASLSYGASGQHREAVRFAAKALLTEITRVPAWRRLGRACFQGVDFVYGKTIRGAGGDARSVTSA